MEYWEVHYRINEQQKIQKKAWDPGIFRLEDYDLEVIYIFPRESNAGASFFPFQIPSSMLDQD